ncbi:MAG: OpgC domain-containing protein [Candidatus Sericytochromatia bacterium]
MISEKKEKRDLTIDFLRGLAMFVLIIIHVEIFSFYNFLVWERVGIISGGEGFVILSGLITGIVYKSKLLKEGLKETTKKLFTRAFQIYRVNIFIILSILFISFIGLFDTKSVMTFIDYSINQEYNLYGDMNTPFNIIKKTLLLQVGPHQTQILGLYAVLMLLAPFALYLIAKNLSFLVVIISFGLYFFNQKYNINLTGCQFENAFPLLTWQVLFFNGMVFGANKEIISKKLDTNIKKVIFYLALSLGLVFFIFAQNNPNPLVPDFTKLHLIDNKTYYEIYNKYFLKNTLGILRLVNYMAFLIVAYNLINKFKDSIYKYLGWFFIPIGQSTLYVFICHVYLVMLASNFVKFGFYSTHLFSNTLVHTTIFILLWIMVKSKFLFDVIPR